VIGVWFSENARNVSVFHGIQTASRTCPVRCRGKATEAWKLTLQFHLTQRCMHLYPHPPVLHGMVTDQAQGQLYVFFITEWNSLPMGLTCSSNERNKNFGWTFLGKSSWRGTTLQAEKDMGGSKYYVFGHYPSSCLYLKTVLFIFSNHNFSETGFCLRLQAKPTPYLRR
jgi:hypothetical protein